MPWLSRRTSLEDSVKPVNEDSQHSDKSPIKAMVNFIPAQIDGLCGTMPNLQRREASGILWGDIRLLIQNMGCLSAMVKTACSAKVLRSLIKDPLDARDTLLQCCIATLQIWILVIAPAAFICLPGLVFAGFFNTLWLLMLAMTWPLSGPRIWTNGQEKAQISGDFSEERWIYVNGIMCR